ncbi:MAG TPA: hypothetical protein VF762_19700, partial [Blastocatellia bacterium]
MNTFPLAPFLTSLAADGIRVTLNDYDRISLMLRTGGPWTIERLRGVLLALLVKHPEQEKTFLRRFDSFFSLEQDPGAEISDDDTTRALENIRKLLDREPEVAAPAPRIRKAAPDPYGAVWRLTPWHYLVAVLALALCVAIFFQARHRAEPGPMMPDLPDNSVSKSPPAALP